MHNLFIFDEDFNVRVDPQLLTLKPFADVAKKYKKLEAINAEFSYIAFLLHPKSDFSDIRNEEDRKETILSSMHGAKLIKIDKITERAIEFYKERYNTVKTNFLAAALDTLDKTTDYLKGVDYKKRDAKLALIYKPKEVIEIIERSPKLMASIKELEEQIRKDEEVENSLRGAGKKGVYEDG